ncbi:MAG: shikimate dehydrogenase [Candidatus Tectomicrobia bacterium]|uniref:Shikimate dehydrogenase (NADP(+)) n=1 Tax=Tectimicrobiota bacterium TaxID=2528274 RepID=A0A932GP45_UNCTE|nr:shikimate dehydrogenase [Candidatus Tectomicrobia bacterium]
MAPPPKILGIIGHPVSHSLSPVMQNAAIQYKSLNYVYVAFEVLPHLLGRAIRGIPGLGISGVNVTVPHKEAVLPFLDRISPEARFIGAVNTIVREKEELIGYNTDGIGFSRALAQEGNSSLAGKALLLLGAGGAARAVAAQAATEGARELIIANRSLPRAQRLETDLLGKFPDLQCRSLPLDSTAIEPLLPTVDLLVNATTRGMRPGDPPPVSLAGLPRHTMVYDLIYNPPVTELIRISRQRGNPALNGLGMLIYQGAASFELWTGSAAPIDVMKKALEIALGSPNAGD